MFSFRIKMIIAILALTIGSTMAIKSHDSDSPSVSAVFAHDFNHDQAEYGIKNSVLAKGKMAQTKLYPVASGAWGGRGTRLIVDRRSVKIEFDCAQGEIRQPLKIDAKGNFKVDGFYKREPFGPILKDNQPQFVPAIYKGKIVGKSMSFTVSLVGSDEPLAEFVIIRSGVPRITKCR